MAIQIVLILFILFAYSRVIRKSKERLINRRVFFLWTILWVSAAVVVIKPNIVNRLADLFGVGRGVDVVIYLSLALLFYLVFRVVIKIDQIERQITKLVRQEALKKDK